MTIIVAQKTTTGVLMGADSSVNDGARLIRRAEPKLWNVTPRIAIGCSGNVRLGEVMRNAKWPLLTSAEPARISGMLGDFFRDAFKDEAKDAKFWSIVAVDGEIFYVACDHSVTKVDAKYCALGSGELVALGALYVLNENDRAKHWSPATARDIVATALEAAAEHVEGLRGPWVFAETKS